MLEPDWSRPLTEAFDRAAEYLGGLPNLPVGPRATLEELRATFDRPLPEGPEDASTVVRELAEAVEGGLLPTGSGRFFGFVFGGATPAAMAADWLTAAWDQNAFVYASSPAAAVAEEVAGSWLKALFGLPPTASVGFVTGAQMANVTGLAAARHDVLRRAGWDVERRGLVGGPPIRLLAGAERHGTIDRAVRLIGLGTDSVVPVDVDAQGRMRPEVLEALLRAGSGPTIVCAQVGNVNTGALDPIGAICDIAHEAGAWVHVDGAFGLWAAASPRTRPLITGIERADSWATDAHKWLNVPYDSGLVFCADPAAHRAAMSVRAAYLMHAGTDERDAMDHNPEASRRARGFVVYAAIRALGREGIAELVDRSCRLARRFAERLTAYDGVEVLNEVMLNQVLVRFLAADGDHDGLTQRVLTAVQREGTCWMSGTTWQGRSAMRISVSNWSTDEDDVDRSVEAIVRCLQFASGVPMRSSAHANSIRTPLGED
jgi:glutamate/tyrosine decarboxylase-like PLP-dependent enzyme